MPSSPLRCLHALHSAPISVAHKRALAERAPAHGPARNGTRVYALRPQAMPIPVKTTPQHGWTSGPRQTCAPAVGDGRMRRAAPSGPCNRPVQSSPTAGCRSGQPLVNCPCCRTPSAGPVQAAISVPLGTQMPHNQCVRRLPLPFAVLSPTSPRRSCLKPAKYREAATRIVVLWPVRGLICKPSVPRSRSFTVRIVTCPPRSESRSRRSAAPAPVTAGRQRRRCTVPGERPALGRQTRQSGPRSPLSTAARCLATRGWR